MKFEGTILGKMRQQVGKSFIFTVWKGIQVAKQYAAPSNPKTIPQLNQRAKFSTCLMIAQNFTTAMINTYWRKYSVKMSAFNAFMRANLNAVGFPVNFKNLVFAKGSLYAQTISTATYTDSNGKVDISFPTTLSGNQLATDYMQAVVVDTSNNFVYYNDTLVQRSAGAVTFDITAGLSFGTLQAFLFAYRNLGATNEAISNSGNSDVSEP